ncbi:MAG: hypothetical protein KC421_09775, partial [Anaerolineales bacterium]|nr:hypothetical protein [Anaerolineales bacterium]
MILPTALATSEIVPSNLRAIGLMPFIFYLPAMGLIWLHDWIVARWPQIRPFPLTATILLLTLAVGLPQTAHTYFQQWAPQAELYLASDGDLADVARFLDDLPITDETIYVAALHYQHPTLAFLSKRYAQVKWLPQSQALVFAPDNPSIVIFPANSPASAWMMPYLEDAVMLKTGPDIGGAPAFTAYKITTPPAIEPTWETAVNFGNAITLNGYEVSGAASGEMMQLTLFWQVNRNLAANFTPFIHLEDRWGDRWSQVEPFAYPTGQWAEGEQIIQHVELPVPPGTPIGDYQVRIGLFNPDDGSRLARFDENGRFVGNTFVIADIPITAGRLPDTLPQPDFVLDTTVLPGLQLLGYERGANSAATGESIGVRFWWVAAEPVQPLTTRLELLRLDGVGGAILSSAAPVHDTYPFPSWQTPQFVIDQQTALIPHDLEAGDYLLQMRVLNAIDDTLYTAELGPLTVVSTERQFTAPPVETPLTALFGGEIGLVGYNLRQQTAAEAVLELVWQAAAVPTTDYTVFVHLLTQNGRCDPCVWQQDVMPQQNHYPTSRWAAGEVVVDSYAIQLPPDLAAGTYPIEVGLYIAGTGQRLQVVQPNEPPGDVVLLRPLRIGE